MLSVILACNCEDLCPVDHEEALYQVGIVTGSELRFYRRELAPSLFALFVNLFKRCFVEPFQGHSDCDLNPCRKIFHEAGLEEELSSKGNKEKMIETLSGVHDMISNVFPKYTKLI